MIKSKINRIHTSGGKSMRTERIKTDVLIIGGGTLVYATEALLGLDDYCMDRKAIKKC